jgi:hypothetical protein
LTAALVFTLTFAWTHFALVLPLKCVCAAVFACCCCCQAIKKLQMLDSGKAQVTWTLSGGLSGMSLSIPITSEFELNLVTGRVTSHM